jgi:hypothetical protein
MPATEIQHNWVQQIISCRVDNISMKSMFEKMSHSPEYTFNRTAILSAIKNTFIEMLNINQIND